MHISLDDAAIAYDYIETLSGQPPVLFLHGALGVRGQFDAMRQRFPLRPQIAMDFAAHGESTIGQQTMNCERLARDTLALLDALDIAKVDVIGHSLGGYVGMVLAHSSPDRVRSVVTLGTKFYWSEDAIGKTLGELDADVLRTRSQRYYDSLKAMHTGSGADTALGLTHSLIADFTRWQLTEEMVRETSVPLMLCTGDRDGMVPPGEVAKLFAAIDARRNAMAVLPNSAHALHQVALDCLEAAVNRFWQQIG